MPTPTLVQHVTGPVGVSAVTSYKLPLPNKTLANNCLIVSVTTNTSAPTVTVADDKSNTYTSAASVVGNQLVQTFVSLGSTAGATLITVSISPGQNFVQVVFDEFYNVATSSALDGTSTGSTTGASVATGAITTTADGDLIYQVAWADSGSQTTSWTAGTSPWKLISVDFANSNLPGMAVQYQVQSAHGSITPSMTKAPSGGHFDTVAIALKSASAGTAPSATGIRVFQAYHASMLSVTSPLTLQFPTTGNLFAIAWIGDPAVPLTAVSDSKSNTWAFAGGTFDQSNGAGSLRIAYAANATADSAMTITLTIGGTPTGPTAIMYDIVGAATAPFDSTAGNPTASGNDSTTGTHTVSTVSITPSAVNGLVLAMMGQNSNTNTGVSPGQFIAAVSSPESFSGDMDENNGWAIEYNTTTSSRTYVFTVTGGAAAGWSAMAAVFAAPIMLGFEDDSFNTILVPAVDPIISVW